jgi:hypothetical protein
MRYPFATARRSDVGVRLKRPSRAKGEMRYEPLPTKPRGGLAYLSALQIRFESKAENSDEQNVFRFASESGPPICLHVLVRGP